MTTKTVRIALVINERGEWSCCGFTNGKPQELMDLAIDGLEVGLMENRYWITAEVEVPGEPVTIAADVSRD